MWVGEQAIERAGLESATTTSRTGPLGEPRGPLRDAPEAETSSAETTGSRYQKLRCGVRGANGLTRAEVAANQRTRIYEAMVEVAATGGYPATTVKAVCALAAVSRRTFYDLFAAIGQRSPKEACFLGAYDFVVGRAAGRINRAYRAEHDPERRLCRAFEQFAREVADEPQTARVALVEVLGAGPAALARMQRTRTIFERMIGASLAEGPGGVALPAPLVKGIVCGIERITRRLLLAGDIGKLPALSDELLAWVLSYRTPAAATLTAAASPARPRAPARWLPRTRIENDRARILCCAARIAAAKGYAQLTPARIARDAEVSDQRFDELFESPEQCFLDALDRLGLEVLVCVARAARSSDDPLIGLHRGIVALLRHIADDPVLVRVAFVEVFALGPPGIQRRERLLGQFTDLLAKSLPSRGATASPARPSRRPRESRLSRASGAPGAPPDLALEASVGAIWGLVHQQVTRGAAHRLPDLAGYAGYLALAPAIGGESAVQLILAGRTVYAGHPA
jgi:AcrR family transcriptional regulator